LVRANFSGGNKKSKKVREKKVGRVVIWARMSVRELSYQLYEEVIDSNSTAQEVGELISQGAEPWMFVDTYHSIFHIAVDRDRLDLVKVMVKHGSPVVSTRARSTQPVALSRSEEMATYLCAKGAINVPEPKRKYIEESNAYDPPLIDACTKQNIIALRALLAHGANVNGEPWCCHSLWVAVGTGNVELVRILLEHNVDGRLGEWNEEGRLVQVSDEPTVIHLAARAQSPEILTMLLWYLKNPNMHKYINHNSSMGTPLSNALSSLCPETVKVLLLMGAGSTNAEVYNLNCISQATRQQTKAGFYFDENEHKAFNIHRRTANDILDIWYKVFNEYPHIWSLKTLCQRAIMSSDIDISFVSKMFFQFTTELDLPSSARKRQK